MFEHQICPAVWPAKNLKLFFESLILAQDERWRCGLGMQVERPSLLGSGERVNNTWVTNPKVRHNSLKGELIPDGSRA